ncbi:MAG: hypothetical protein JWQ19_2975 [Subtercola sp.]|nr:hypothetical protein [Subtercola sp.]
MPTDIEAYVLISDLMGKYIAGVDSGKPPAVSELFGETGTLVVHGGEEFHGSAEIERFLVRSRESKSTNNFGRLRHHLSSLQIETDGSDTATARSYFLAITPRGPDHWGVYTDELVREGDRWRFALRKVVIEGADPSGWIGSGAGAVLFEQNPSVVAGVSHDRTS